MTGKVDLHVHTTASDGALAPREVVEQAHRLGLRLLSITDHDTVAGVGEALARADELGLTVIPGVEISAEKDGVQAHILGYYIDHTSPALIEQLDRYGQARLRRAAKTLERLAEMGMPLAWETISAAVEHGVVGRPHIAQALVEGGFVATIEEAFGRYLNPGQAAYLPRLKATPAQAIQMIHEAGGLPVLAHPWCVTFLLEELVAEGLLGLEAYYRNYDACQVRRLCYLAREHGLVCTGGTDFHGLEGESLSLGETALPCACITELEALHASQMRP
jgi:hypothetical protein